MNLMPTDKVTDRAGRWYLRSGYLDAEERIYVMVSSNSAPEGTIARDLRPERLEIMDDTGEDVTILPVARIRELLAWPPDAASGGKEQR